MAAHVTNSRKGLRRLERATGEKLVWATGSFVTTIDHRHLLWTGEHWSELEQPDMEGGCGMWPRLSSCEWLFGEPEFGFTRGLMRGPCKTCGVGCSELHRWNCGKLNELMTFVNPDYWPRPVHRPQWMDDLRSEHIDYGTRGAFQLALATNVPIELIGIPNPGTNHWSYWLGPEGT